MIKRDATAKKSLFTLRRLRRGPETANIRSRMLRNVSSIISKADRFTWMLHYRDRFVLQRRNRERVVQAVRAGLKRLSAILRSCLEGRCQTLTFSPENPRRNHIDGERNALAKRRNDERKPRI